MASALEDPPLTVRQSGATSLEALIELRPIYRFGSHQVFPEHHQAVNADSLLQRDVFDQEPFSAAYGPSFA